VFSDVPEQEMRHANTLQLTIQQLGAGSASQRCNRPSPRNSDRHVFSGAGAHGVYTVAFALMACVSLAATIARSGCTPARDTLRGHRATRPSPELA